jgi:carboxymethylenebutenolidase
LGSIDPELSRREFLASSALVAGCVLVAQPAFASAIRTDESGLATGRVSIPVDGGEMRAYFAAPESAASPPVALVVHEIFGVDEYIRDVCRRLAHAGYFAIAPDLFQRQGDVSKQVDPEAISREIVSKVPDDQVFADLDATRAWSKREGKGDPSRVVIAGFSWGGRIAWLYCAHAPDLLAGASWYGPLVGEKRTQTPSQPIDMAQAKHAPVLGLYGTEDATISSESIYEMRQLLVAGGQGSEIVLFPGAPHDFHEDDRASYRMLAASEGWRRMLEWFREHGAAPAPP